QNRGIVLDADALTLFASDPQGFADMVARRDGPVVLTPHAGEFSRLARGLLRKNDSVSQVLESNAQAPDSKLEAARAMARALGTILVLKGPDTVVASPDGRASIAADLPADLATAGSGDVLAGMIGGLLAQGMPAYEAACAAVWLHGAAGRALGRGLAAEDVPEALPGVLALPEVGGSGP
ncbi:MAG: NAD(P)H-hydrate dehydratase, partial [Beijerinckiaceae bacterium]|nr:NAD(P)H-hydrate dehydratase [Beijerinckiaceae bacterium]